MKQSRNQSQSKDYLNRFTVMNNINKTYELLFKDLIETTEREISLKEHIKQLEKTIEDYHIREEMLNEKIAKYETIINSFNTENKNFINIIHFIESKSNVNTFNLT